MPRIKPVNVESVEAPPLEVAFLLLRLVVSPEPVTAKVSGVVPTPVAINVLPATLLVPSYAREPDKTKLALSITKVPVL